MSARDWHGRAAAAKICFGPTNTEPSVEAAERYFDRKTHPDLYA